jgi:predicted MFS family arabinose efflux permease
MPSHRSNKDFKVVACLFSILFLGVADSQVLSPLLPLIQERVGKASSDMGLLFTGYAVCAGLSVLVWGPLSDIFGRKNGLQYGLILFSAGSWISFSAMGFHALLWGRVITGMGASMLSLNSISFAADFFPYRKRGWAMGSIFSSYFAALILGVPFGAWIGDRFGWNSVFGIMGGISLALLIGTGLLLPQVRRNGDSKTEKAFSKFAFTYAGFMKGRSTFGALISAFFASAGMMGFIAFLGKWLSDSFAVSSSKAGLVFLVFGAAAVIASPVAGSIADRVGKRFQFSISSLILALALFFLPNMSWGFPLFVLFFIISVSAAFRQGPMEAVFTEIVSSPSRGMFIALKNSFSQLGIGLATFLSGIMFEKEGYWAVCLLASVSHVIAASGILLTLRKKHL